MQRVNGTKTTITRYRSKRFTIDFFEEAGDRLALHGTIPADVSESGFLVDLDVCDPGAILATIVLFFHQDVHFVHPIGWPILLYIVGKGLA